jgi:hypothetical protein
MFHIINTSSKASPVQNLRANQDIPEDQFSVVVSTEEIEELVEYIQEVTYDPAEINNKIKKILLLYIAAVRFIVLDFDTDSNTLVEDLNLLEHYEKLSKSLYVFYNDLNIILITKEISNACKAHVKLATMIGRLPETSNRKLASSRDRILFGLNQLSSRVKML